MSLLIISIIFYILPKLFYIALRECHNMAFIQPHSIVSFQNQYFPDGIFVKYSNNRNSSWNPVKLNAIIF